MTHIVKKMALGAVLLVSTLGPALAGTAFAHPLPEPETIAMLLAGLGLIAFLSHRLARLDARGR